MARIQVQRNGTKKDVIMRKAAALFRRKGFASSSMRELGETIGVEAPSLYNHIGSKSELLQTICSRIANDFNVHLKEVETSPDNTISKLENLIRFHIHMMLNSYDEVFVANHEWTKLKEPYLSDFLHQRKLYEASLMKIINSGIDKKELKSIDPYVAVLVILSAVRGLEFWHRHKKNVSSTTLENDMVKHLLKGLIN